ncbi:hypothetical protein PVAND_007747 [Polypedilum vanderplanki]|uniref:Spaetzle domain-containing protein n=1 Tax=Polypedilum vanderplanki TaxID=319348 RepID=A0A9J6C860_POLVA|nr:hypothetical protein PVAND_007747 [Polypedilum vanderplanki]
MKIIKILRAFALLIMLFVEYNFASPPPCGNSYGHQPCLYLPAPPHETPKCATKGATFCETIEGYPENLIRKLLKNYEKDILADETKVEFSAKKETPYKYNIPSYGHYHSHHGSFDYHGNFPGEAVSNDHINNNYHHQLPQRGHYSGNSFAGYFYPRPKASSSSFIQVKPSTSINFNHDMHRRTSRQIHPFLNETVPNASQQASSVSLDQFDDALSSKSKRQISSNREQLCEVRSNYINPQAALNVRTGNWMYIVNGIEQATQLVRTETCISTKCSNLCQLPLGYNSKCEQKYVQKRLVTLDPRGDKLFTDTFWFPSCCVCTLSIE